jgi:hypothetical protein
MDRIASIAQIALGGVQRNLRDLQKAAHEIATAPVRRVEPVALSDALVDALVAQRALEACANVVRRTDQALATLLDGFDRRSG